MVHFLSNRTRMACTKKEINYKWLLYRVWYFFDVDLDLEL